MESSIEILSVTATPFRPTSAIYDKIHIYTIIYQNRKQLYLIVLHTIVSDCF